MTQEELNAALINALDSIMSAMQQMGFQYTKNQPVVHDRQKTAKLLFDARKGIQSTKQDAISAKIFTDASK